MSPRRIRNNKNPPPSVEYFEGDLSVGGDFTSGDLIAVGVCAAPGLAFLLTKHFVLHNLFAIAFCVQALHMVSLGQFKHAFIMLWGLFVYDVFWVFGTDVMVTVAKSFEAPAKIIFPISFDPWKQGILGLGDIVVPGLFVAMCLRCAEGRGPAAAGTETERPAKGAGVGPLLGGEAGRGGGGGEEGGFCGAVAAEGALEEGAAEGVGRTSFEIRRDRRRGRWRGKPRQFFRGGLPSWQCLPAAGWR